mgnify:FL=1
MDSYGLSQAIGQSQNVTREDMENNQKIADMNNNNLQLYLGKVKDQARQSVEDKQVQEAGNLGKIANYTMGIKDKVDQYNEVVKAGGEGGIRGSKLLYKWPNQLKKAFVGKQEVVPSLDAPEGPTVTKTTLGGPVQKARAEGTVVDSGDVVTGYSSIHIADGQGNLVPHKVIDASGNTAPDPTRPTVQEDIVDPTPVKKVTPIEPGQPGGEVSTIKAVGEEGSSLATKVGRFGGGVLSVATLGDDVYNQVKQKTFWAGENTGDKVGNFMNEAGSTADILGLVTGDPFLVLAGVGLGAVGAVTSEISELFGPDDSAKPKPIAKPKAVASTSGANLAGSGAVAETGKSTLKQVQMGSY